MKFSPKQLEARDIVAKGAYYPSLVKEDDGWHARWRAIAVDNDWVDEFVRAAAVSPLTEDAEDHQHKTLHDAWLMALKSRTGLVRWDDAECGEFAALLKEWASRLVCTSLAFAFESNGADGFQVVCECPRTRSGLRTLGEATYVWGKLREMKPVDAESLPHQEGMAHPLSVPLDRAEAEDFLRRGARKLVEAGYEVSGVDVSAPISAEAEVNSDATGKVGKVEVVERAKLIAGTSVASCGIAYAMRYISASAQGAKMLGLNDSSIRKVVCQTIRGAAELISQHKSEPEREIDRVTTPNGLTIKGLYAMEDAGFSESVIKGLTVNTAKKHRIVVKVGSNVLTRHDGALNTTRVSSIVDQIVNIRKLGYEVILVTSGAVACGRSLIRQNRKLDEVQQRQLYSALGQVRLMDLYYKLFIDYGVNVGQILTMKNSFERKRDYATQRECMEVMLASGVVPIVNENDAVAIKELMFTDNDELSGLVATMMGAEKLIILSNIDGIYDGDPKNPQSKVIAKVSPKDEVEQYISTSKSEFGRGGMISKCGIALKTAASGIEVIIANGNRDNIITDVLTHPEETIHTEFVTE